MQQPHVDGAADAPASPAPPDLAQHAALPVLLAHPSCHEQPLLLALLATSQAVRAAVAHACRGVLALEVVGHGHAAAAKAAALGAWLRSFAGLAGSLALDWDRVGPLPVVEEPLSTALAAATAAAAAAPSHSSGGSGAFAGAPQLRAVKANAAGPLLLQALPPATLTSLELGHVVDYTAPGDAAAALAKLTGLGTLTVLSSATAQLLPAASALGRLTHVCCLLRNLPANAGLLAHLPSCLRRLELTVAWGGASASDARPPLPLAHCSALQELRCSGYLELQQQDALPPSLVSVQAPDCSSVRPLTCLTALTTLNLYNSTTRSHQLEQLGRALPQLSELSLGYFGSEDAPDLDACAPGWPLLAGLRSLDFDSNCGEFHLSSLALGSLGRLGHRLTHLALSGGVCIDATPSGLACVLGRLQGLHTLRLAGVELQPEEEEEPQQQQPGRGGRRGAGRARGGRAAGRGAGSGAGSGQASAGAAGAAAAAAAAAPAGDAISGPRRLMAAIAGLTSLRTLKLGGLGAWLGGPGDALEDALGALAPLGARLTSLQLMQLQLTDALVQQLVCGSMAALRELDVSDNPAVTDAALASLAVLSQLRNLDISGCGVSDDGVAALRAAAPCLADVVCFQSSDDEES